MKTRTFGVALSTISALIACSGAVGSLPEYTAFQLQARSNFAANPGGAFNIPGSHFFTNSTPAINDQGHVAIWISTVAGPDVDKIWYGGDGAGGIVYTSPENASLSDVSLNNANRIVFPQSFASPTGIILLEADSGANAVAVPLGGPFGLTSFGSPQINASGQIGFRGATTGVGQSFVSADGTSQARHATEAGVEPSSPNAFLFTPAFNDARQIAGKTRLGAAGQTDESRPDEIRVWNADGSSTLIAHDRDANPASPYARFDNSVALDASGRVAFIATLAAGGRGVYLSDGMTTLEIARSGAGDVGDIEFFRPALSGRGYVAFRAFDSAGLRAIWVGDGTTLRKVIAEHDIVPTDQGDARIDQNDSSPVFGGSPSINERGDIAFQATLTPPDDNQVEWGSGLFVAYASSSADLDGDGVLTLNDFVTFRNLYVAGDLRADFDGNGALTLNDFVAFRNAYTAG